MSAITATNSFLTTLVGQGNDAQTNLYLANFTITESGKTIEAGTIRCDGFTPPAPSQDSYPVKFVNVHIDRPRAKIQVDKFFDLTFRVDANYEMYKVLKDLESLNLNANADTNKSEISLDGIADRDMWVSIDVPGIEKLYLYKKCWVESVTPIAFKQGTSEPAKVTARINYLEFDDYQDDAIKDLGSSIN